MRGSYSWPQQALEGPWRLSNPLRRLGLPALLIAALTALAALVLFCFDPSLYAIYPVCWFHRTTGLLCPGCGSLRALHQLLHGHITTAFRFNPLLMGSLPFVLWWAARFAVRPAHQQPASLPVHPRWLWLFLAAAVAFTVWRNVPGAPFANLPQ
jgi:hypothetical protein